MPLEVYLVQDEATGAALPMAWGLRCRESLVRGQVVGVYLGLVGKASQLNNDSEYQLSLSHFHDALYGVHLCDELKQVRWQSSLVYTASEVLALHANVVLQRRCVCYARTYPLP